MLGLLEFLSGNVAGAEQHLGLAERLVGEGDSPGGPEWLSTLAYGHGRLGDADAARRAFERFASRVPNPERIDPASWIYAYLAIDDIASAYEWAVHTANQPLPPFISQQLAFMRNTTRDPRLEEERFIELRRKMGYAE